MASPCEPAADGDLFARLRNSCEDDWQAFVDHEFVRRLGDGSLAEDCFRHYLAQDYLFLIHFSRAYALAVFKSEDLDDMRQAAATLDALLNSEMSLHLRTCAGWGMSEADLVALPEADQNMAYTRFVLEKGVSGDLLDLLVALAPCVVGYGEIGARLLAAQQDHLVNNPYRDWIETYGGAEYREVAQAAITQLDRVARRRLDGTAERSARWSSLARTFRAATRLEVGFWNMGMAPPERRP